ncbi:hypothetical protein JCM24511_07667 [Saitozyma sp. JCM 24511]|nr:hypothetical protein JCM24511_07667 [Saitozyma sp. JCM 24511]
MRGEVVMLTTQDRPTYNILNLKNHIYDYHCASCMGEVRGKPAVVRTQSAPVGLGGTNDGVRPSAVFYGGGRGYEPRPAESSQVKASEGESSPLELSRAGQALGKPSEPRCCYCIMIIQARTKKKMDMGYTANAVRESGSLVPLKKFMDAVE